MALCVEPAVLHACERALSSWRWCSLAYLSNAGMDYPNSCKTSVLNKSINRHPIALPTVFLVHRVITQKVVSQVMAIDGSSGCRWAPLDMLNIPDMTTILIHPNKLMEGEGKESF